MSHTHNKSNRVELSRVRFISLASFLKENAPNHNRDCARIHNGGQGSMAETKVRRCTCLKVETAWTKCKRPGTWSWRLFSLYKSHATKQLEERNNICTRLAMSERATKKGRKWNLGESFLLFSFHFCCMNNNKRKNCKWRDFGTKYRGNGIKQLSAWLQAKSCIQWNDWLCDRTEPNRV